jgi:hypothetical protein
MSPLHSACDKLQDNQSDIRGKRLLFRSPRIRRQGQPGGKRGWLAPTLEAAFFPEVGASSHRAGGLLGERAGPGQRAGDA